MPYIHLLHSKFNVYLKFYSIKIDINLYLKDSLDLYERSIVFLTNNKNVLSFGKLDGNLFKPQKVFI